MSRAHSPNFPSLRLRHSSFSNVSVALPDHLFGIVVITFDCHPRGPGFDSRLYPKKFPGSIGSGTGFTQRREENWVAT